MYYCFNFEEEADPRRPKNSDSNSQVLEHSMRGGVRRSRNEMDDMSVEKSATAKGAE